MEIRIVKYSDIENDIITFFKNSNLIPIVGSGISCGVSACKGKVPSGSKYMEHMSEELKKKISDDSQNIVSQASFSQLCEYYDSLIDKQIRTKYLRENFRGACFAVDDIRKSFFEIDWPYVYTLNIDDAIENSTKFKNIILPGREVRDEAFDECSCLIKLHGDINDILTYRDATKVFSTIEYVKSIENNKCLLEKLKNDYINQNLIYIGCSLSDEFDIKLLGSFSAKFEKKEKLRKIILFVQGVPNEFEIIRYKNCGITDIVTFDNFQSMYESLLNSWKKSQEIDSDEISYYEKYDIVKLRPKSEENYACFFYGQSLLDVGARKIIYPHYFICRRIAKKITDNLDQNTLHIIVGGRISGKSYVLADLYERILDRKVCFFDAKIRLSNNALNDILAYKNAVVLFDSGTLNREQLTIVLQHMRDINKNKSNCIFCINASDRELQDVVKIQRREDAFLERIKIYNLQNRFSSKEIWEINSLLPAANIPVYKKTHSIIDHILYAEDQLQQESRFSEFNISVKTDKELVFFIIMATKEKMTSLETIKFDVDREAMRIADQYPPLIERVASLKIEKSANDISSVKYILNSKYWLRRQLYEYVKNKENYKTVLRAYKYIIEKIVDRSSKKYPERRLYKDYILFDTINDIFLNEFGGNIKLIVDIYAEIHELIATDYNYLHQYAKALIHYSYTFTNRNDHYLQRTSILLKAKEQAAIAESIAEECYNRTKNENILISIAHINFSQASIACSLCRMHDYTNDEEVKECMAITAMAIDSPYNRDIENRLRLSQDISSFLIKMQKLDKEGLLPESLIDSFSQLSKVRIKNLEKIIRKNIE